MPFMLLVILIGITSQNLVTNVALEKKIRDQKITVISESDSKLIDEVINENI